eukprot:m.82357 g.82357  ORF g.82357 m.82357 type:complete len:311 (+) comp9460_c0_seq1:277-1209(+)
MLATWVLCTSAAVGLVAGVLIGSVGVGGIIIVPTLIELPDVSVQTAIASAMFSYIAVGIAGTGAYMRQESVLWQSAGWLVLGATPGGFAGAFTLQYLADLEVKLTLYGLVLISAVYSLYRTVTDGQSPSNSSTSPNAVGGRDIEYAGAESFHDPGTVDPFRPTNAGDVEGKVMGSSNTTPAYATLSGRILRIVVGLVDGFGSAITGTSGPVILLPILIALHWDILDALGSAQAVQAPIAGAATVAYVTLRPGTINFVLGGCLMAGLVPGALIGATIAHSVPVRKLKLLVSAILVIASAFLIGKLVWVEVH